MIDIYIYGPVGTETENLMFDLDDQSRYELYIYRIKKKRLKLLLGKS